MNETLFSQKRESVAFCGERTMRATQLLTSDARQNNAASETLLRYSSFQLFLITKVPWRMDILPVFHTTVDYLTAVKRGRRKRIFARPLRHMLCSRVLFFS